jgi:uncharacterized protein (DUF885 family)
MKTRLVNYLSLCCLLVLLAGCGKVPQAITPEAIATLSGSPTVNSAIQPTTVPPTAPTSLSEATLFTSDMASFREKLQNLPIDQFFELSYRELLLRDPEAVVEAGLTAIYPLALVELTDISDTYLRETYAMQQVILDLLRTYDRSTLDPMNGVTYDVFAWYLEDQLAGQEFIYHDYPVTMLTTNSIPMRLVQFFSDIHPLANQQDVEDYITRLGLIDTKLQQLQEGLELRKEAGIVPPRFVLQAALPDMRSLISTPALSTPFYRTLETKLSQVPGMEAGEQQAYLDSTARLIEEEIQPAYRTLIEYIEELAANAPTTDGVWQFPQGEAYYNYTLRHHTTTELTADQIHEIGYQELERVHAEMRIIFDQLGYPQEESLTQLYRRAIQDGGSVAGDQVLQVYTELIEGANQRLDEIIDLRPRLNVIVVGDQYGGFYVPGAYDGSRPGMFYANVSGASEPYYAMPSLAYHEAVPGHHLQIALAQELTLPALRHGLFFTAYAEGWALYAERLAQELGWYTENPYGDLGRLQYEAFRAARLVVDTGIHAKGWTFNQAYQFMEESVGFDPSVINLQHQVARYIAWPGQATSYMIGYLKILELRQSAQEMLGDRFDLVDFHHTILTSGSVPLSVLEDIVQEYISSKR